MSSHQYEVVIIQKRLPQYRKPFFELLRKELAQHNIKLVLIYGRPGNEQKQRKDNVEISWAQVIRNREIKVGEAYLLWQPCLTYLKKADLVIVEQASKLLVNYVLFLSHKLGMIKLCFWGHGKGLMAKKGSLGEQLKASMSRGVHWWFAYNDLSARIVGELDFPPQRITSVQNAVDTYRLIKTHDALTKKDCDSFRKKHNISSENVCLFIGSLYAERRIDYLLEACKVIREKIPDFEILVLGAGPEERKVKEAAQIYNWIHFKGPVFGEEKVPFFKISKLVLLPGPVGLVVVESFAMETPIVTVDISTHGPEVDYISDGKNGVIVKEAHDVEKYALQVVELLRDFQTLNKLKAACKAAKEKYTLETMVERFSEGVQKALRSSINKF